MFSDDAYRSEFTGWQVQPIEHLESIIALVSQDDFYALWRLIVPSNKVHDMQFIPKRLFDRPLSEQQLSSVRIAVVSNYSFTENEVICFRMVPQTAAICRRISSILLVLG